MTHQFEIKSIDYPVHLFQSSDEELAQIGAKRMLVDQHPGFPCRVSLEDAQLGEEVILFPFKHHATNSPYQASGPVFVRKNVAAAQFKPNEIPEMLQFRFLSLRAYDKEGFMLSATTTEGEYLSQTIQELFTSLAVSYIHVHNAGPGCYNCCIERI